MYRWGKQFIVEAIDKVNDIVETKIDPIVGCQAPLPRTQLQYVVPSSRIYVGALALDSILKELNRRANL